MFAAHAKNVLTKTRREALDSKLADTVIAAPCTGLELIGESVTERIKQWDTDNKFANKLLAPPTKGKVQARGQSNGRRSRLMRYTSRGGFRPPYRPEMGSGFRPTYLPRTAILPTANATKCLSDTGTQDQSAREAVSQCSGNTDGPEKEIECGCIGATANPGQDQVGLVWFRGLTPQQQPGSYQGGEMMMKSVFSGGGNRSTRRKPPTYGK